LDGFEPAIRLLLTDFPDMPATVIAERIGWAGSSSVLRARVAQLRPLFRPADPADRTTYVAGEIVQCDLWFPGKVIPVGGRVLANPPVLTMVAAYSGFIMALLLPSRTTGDLLAGMWRLLSGLGAVPKTLVWDNESGIGQHHRLTVGARSFAGTLGTRIYQTAARDPEAKGIIEDEWDVPVEQAPRSPVRTRTPMTDFARRVRDPSVCHEYDAVKANWVASRAHP